MAETPNFVEKNSKFNLIFNLQKVRVHSTGKVSDKIIEQKFLKI